MLPFALPVPLSALLFPVPIPLFPLLPLPLLLPSLPSLLEITVHFAYSVIFPWLLPAISVTRFVKLPSVYQPSKVYPLLEGAFNRMVLMAPV